MNVLRGCAFVILAAWTAAAQQPPLRQFRLPPQQPPVQFGNVFIRRATASGTAKAVTFSHWSHRIRYTCRVCHLELDFAMRANTTEITEGANQKGAYCGACHDGKIAFGHTKENCERCHSGTPDAVPPGFMKLDLPLSKFGNGIDWSLALSGGWIHPVPSLATDYEPLTLNTTLSLEAEWNFVSPATFPHAEHVRWLDCANCHPAIFNIKKKTTQHFSMMLNLRGEFCGACHLRVAFPLDDCRRCHPAMRDQPMW